MEGVGSILGGVFGVIWTILAASMGAPVLFTLFGVVAVVFSIVNAGYHFFNAAGKDRFSTFDITGDGEEPDPLDRRSGIRPSAHEGSAFCPFCGEKAEEGYRFCRKCGRELPEK
jgi:hypothetical protein